MRTPNMSQETSQSVPLTGLQPSSQDHSASRQMSNRDRNGSEKDDSKSRISSTTKSDINSDTSRYNRARGPITEAVHSVLEPLDPTHTTIPPELLNQITSQITANVLQQLKASQLSPVSPHAPSNTSEQMDSISSSGGSPPIDRDKVYTPPSPYRASEEAAQHTLGTNPKKQAKYSAPPDNRRPPSPPFSHGAQSDSDAKERGNNRPTAERVATDGDATILEKIWGPLFDDQGVPTIRLSQFLRGIAVHLIEDYEPRHSLVVTPDKMQRYYEETILAKEIYTWSIVFDDRTSSISRMFRELEAQHHLIQDRLDERPDIPGLTPVGFETWMTNMLKAHPDEEFERLAYTALHMPVSNPDDRKERFPKELSRRQFPKAGDGEIAEKLGEIVLLHCGVRAGSRNGSVSDKETRPIQSTTKPQDTSHKPSQPENILSQTSTRSTIPSDTERNHLRQAVSEASSGDTVTATGHPPQIERERKPYVAHVGGGKNYENIDAHVTTQPAVTSQPAESRSLHSGPPPPSKLTRSASLNNGRPTDPRNRPAQPISVHQKSSQGPVPPPIDIPPPSRTRTGSTYHRDAPRRSDRNRSPSSSRTNGIPTRTDGNVTYGSGPYHTSSSAGHASNNYRSDNRYDHRPSGSSATPQQYRDRASFSSESGHHGHRESRPRYNSVSAGDGHRYHKDYSSEDEHRRAINASYGGADLQHTVSQPYPPNSYRGQA